MTQGLDPKRIKDVPVGGAPPSEGFIGNKFSGLDAEQGEKYPVEPVIEPNRFPRERGSDSAEGFAGGDFAG